MSREMDKPIERDSAVMHAEGTLRLIASLPAPAGIEDRVHATLALARIRKAGRVLAWPAAGKGSANAWLRSVAAAMIAVVVMGGGYGVFLRVQPWQTQRAIPMPVPRGPAGGFGSAGAVRTPQTVNGPVLTHPVKAQATPDKAEKKAAEVQIANKPGPQKKH